MGAVSSRGSSHRLMMKSVGQADQSCNSPPSGRGARLSFTSRSRFGGLRAAPVQIFRIGNPSPARLSANSHRPLHSAAEAQSRQAPEHRRRYRQPLDRTRIDRAACGEWHCPSPPRMDAGMSSPNRAGTRGRANGDRVTPTYRGISVRCIRVCHGVTLRVLCRIP